MNNTIALIGLTTYITTLIALSAISIFYGGSISTKKVPMQWSLNGDPTWYADKQIGLWFPVVLFLLVGAALLYKAISSSTPLWTDYAALASCCVLMTGVHYWHVSKVVLWAQKQF